MMRHGLTLLELVAGIVVSSLVLAAVVPLYLSARRAADRAGEEAVITRLAREVGAVFAADVRSAANVQVSAAGTAVLLGQPPLNAEGAATVRYAFTGIAWTRVRTVGGRIAERSDTRLPLTKAVVGNEGRAVSLTLVFSLNRRAAPKERVFRVTATPRVGL
jgi:type II secretory pathway pseudopilin PulG